MHPGVHFEEWMNERIAFVISVLCAELGGSLAWHWVAPASMLSAGALHWQTYVVQHLLITLVMWAVLFPASWLLGPSRLWRRRVQRSTRLKMLRNFGCGALIVDTLSTLYHVMGLADQGPPAMPSWQRFFFTLGVREALWVAVYVLVVGVLYVYGNAFPERDPHFGQDAVD